MKDDDMPNRWPLTVEEFREMINRQMVTNNIRPERRLTRDEYEDAHDILDNARVVNLHDLLKKKWDR